MGPVIPTSRRAFLSSSVLLVAGCTAVPFLSSKNTPLSPQETLQTYFSLLASSRYADAQKLMTPSYQQRLGRDGVSELLHSIRTAQVTDIIDAVAWADDLGAKLPAPPADRREYLVTLQITPSAAGRGSWSNGMNRRFIDLLSESGRWKIDSIATMPGVLVTGQTAKPGNLETAVLPISPLRLGPAPVDRAIYTARQNAADRGAIAWARDPLQVVHYDGPSFGLNPSDPAEILRRDQDPVSLVPRVAVVVHQGDAAYVVTLIQPIRSGKNGIWAISEVERYTPTQP